MIKSIINSVGKLANNILSMIILILESAMKILVIQIFKSNIRLSTNQPANRPLNHITNQPSVIPEPVLFYRFPWICGSSLWWTPRPSPRESLRFPCMGFCHHRIRRAYNGFPIKNLYLKKMQTPISLQPDGVNFLYLKLSRSSRTQQG